MKKIYIQPTVCIKALNIESLLNTVSITTPAKKDYIHDGTLAPGHSGNIEFFNPADQGGGGVWGDGDLDF